MYDINQILNAIEKSLDEKEKTIFKARHGVESEPITLERLCSKFKISSDVLISIEGKVLRCLRQENV